jgi:hypothetical protein
MGLEPDVAPGISRAFKWLRGVRCADHDVDFAVGQEKLQKPGIFFIAGADLFGHITQTRVDVAQVLRTWHKETDVFAQAMPKSQHQHSAAAKVSHRVARLTLQMGHQAQRMRKMLRPNARSGQVQCVHCHSARPHWSRGANWRMLCQTAEWGTPACACKTRHAPGLQ